MKQAQPKHFLTLKDLSAKQIQALIQRAIELKQQRKKNIEHSTLKGKILAMIFQKASTRTRISFETGITQLGGSALFISDKDTQLNRGEPIADTAKVISSMVDCIMIRAHSHQDVCQLAEHSQVPVINGLTDQQHPCQLLADYMTITETFQHTQNLKLAWIGDGNNMCNSTIQLAHILNLQLNIYTPKNYQANELNAAYLKDSSNIKRYDTAEEALQGVHVVSTDVWSSMGDESQTAQRKHDFANCQINQQRMQLADKDAIFLHCLPAHRGEEVTSEIIDGKQSKVWQQAENRLHAQKALMELILNAN